MTVYADETHTSLIPIAVVSAATLETQLSDSSELVLKFTFSEEEQVKARPGQPVNVPTRLELQRGEHGWISAEGGCSTTFDPSEGAEPDGSLPVKAATNCSQPLDYVGDASSAVTIASVSFAVTL